jgi:hypothetical protein
MSKKLIISYLWQETLFTALIFFVGTFIMLITWPYVGSSFFKHFIKMFMISKDFPWDNGILYKGTVLPGNHLPRFYVPTIFFIKTPAFILFFLFSSLFFVLKKSSNKILFLLWMVIVINLGLYLALRPVSVIRHFLFLFPVVATIAAVGCVNTLQYFSKNIKIIIMTLAFISMIGVVMNMIHLFPYEYIYFNELVGGFKNAKQYFTADSWAQANKEGALWLSQYTKGKGEFNVYVCGNGFSAYYYFPTWLHYVKEQEKADYSLCIPATSNQEPYIKGKLIHTIFKDNLVLIRIYKNTKSL